MREPLPGVFLTAESSALGLLEKLKATAEAGEVVMHGRLGKLKGEPAGVITARIHGLSRFALDGQRLIGTAGDHQTVKQRRPEPGSQIGRQIWQRQSRAGIVGAQVRRDVEHAGDAKTYSSLFLSWEHVPERGVGEPPAFLSEASGEQGDSTSGNQWSPKRMPNRRQLQCPARKLGSGRRIRRPKGVSGLQQSGDGGFVTELGAVSEVLCHLDGERAPGQEHV